MRYGICPFCDKSREMYRDWPATWYVFMRHNVSEGVECPSSGLDLQQARELHKKKCLTHY